MLRHVAIVGVGLIGSSFALAAKRANPALCIVGLDKCATSLAQAQERGAIDTVGSVEQAGSADLILLAIPVRQMADALERLAPYLADHTVIIDAGSTKQDVMAVARSALGARAGQLVATHPIAGRERHGPMAADALLFQGRNVVLCASPANPAAVTTVAREAWQLVGASVVEMSAAAHDSVFAAVSHLPHMLAFALVDELASRPNAKLLFEHAASGFRDFTRIASSSPEMWRDIALNNRGALLAELDGYLAKAKQLRELLADSDEAGLFALMLRARDARERWLSGQLDQFNDDTK